jgi:small multidrug resistance family-3 protein
MLRDLGIYALAALAEIGGCFAFWRWLRAEGGLWHLAAGLVLLALFAALLTRVESTAAGRAYAAYGGIYILASVMWLRVAEGVRPTASDLLGVAVSVAGAAIIMAGARHWPPNGPQ